MGGSDFYRMGLLFLAVAVVLILIGLGLSSGGRYLGWFGNLPGDIRIDGKNYVVRVPLVSGLLVSLLISIVVNLLRRR